MTDTSSCTDQDPRPILATESVSTCLNWVLNILNVNLSLRLPQPWTSSLCCVPGRSQVAAPGQLGRRAIRLLTSRAASESAAGPVALPGSWTTSQICVCRTISPSLSPRNSSASVCWTPRTATFSSRRSEWHPSPGLSGVQAGACSAWHRVCWGGVGAGG